MARTLESDFADLTGGCDCASVRYRLDARPLFTHCCHCTWCQRETGSAFAVNALIETDHLITEGPIEAVETPSASGNGQTIMRCPSCRLALWSHYGGLGGQIAFVRVGTLDQPTPISPDIHIYTDNKQPWVILPDDVPAVGEYYRRSEHWPADSIARLKAARGR